MKVRVSMKFLGFIKIDMEEIKEIKTELSEKKRRNQSSFRTISNWMDFFDRFFKKQ